MSSHTSNPHITADVVIVGAGLAGLSSADHLRGSGYDVHLLEASDRLGGRTWGHYWGPAEQRIDLGASWLMPEFTVARDYADQLGAVLRQTPAPQHFLTHLHDGVRQRQEPDAADMTALRQSHQALTQALDSPGPGPASIHDALTQVPMTNSARHWHVATQRYLAAADFRQVDAQHLLLNLKDLTNPEHYSIEVKGTTGELVNGLRRRIEATLHQEDPVVKVHRQGQTYQVKTATGRVLQSRFVVVAVPLNVLSAIDFQGMDLGSLQEYVQHGHSGASRKDWFILEGVKEHLRIIASTGVFGYFRTRARLPSGHMLAVGLAPAHEGTPTREEFDTALRQYVPTARIVDQYSFDWTAHPWAQGTWVAPPPGYYQALADLGHAQGLHIIGGDVCTEFPGTVEGALRTGVQAAQSIRADENPNSTMRYNQT